MKLKSTDTSINTDTWENAFNKIQIFALQKLPFINDRIVEGRGCVYEISSVIQDDFQKLIRLCLVNNLTQQQGRQILYCVSPIISSLQRHLKTYIHTETHFSQLFSYNVETFLTAIGKKSGLPPRDSHYTTWLYNDSPIYVFDSNPGWKFFWKAVRLTNENNLKAIACLQKLTIGQVDISSPNATVLIKEANNYIKEIFEYYKNFKNGMDTSYFANIFRTYFLEYKIDGISYTGSNATNVVSVPALDFIIGIASEEYKKIVQQRFVHYINDDIAFINQVMKEPTLLQLFAEATGFDYSFFKYATPDELEHNYRFLFLTENLKNSFLAVSNLIHDIASLSKFHFGLINTYLVKQAETQSKCTMGYTAPAVDYSHGVGGASHEETKGIRDMRSNCSIFKKLKIIIK